MAKLYWGDKRVLGIKPPGGEYIDLEKQVILTGIGITVPNGVTSLPDEAFAQASFVTSIVLPDSVTSLGECCFYFCDSLTSITIPHSVTSIGSDCFRYCFSLKHIYFEGDPPSVSRDSFSMVSDGIFYHKADNLNWTADIKTGDYAGSSNMTWSTY